MNRFSLKKILTNEFDYNILMGLLTDYSQPWSKIRSLLRNREIIRVKKGLYIKNPQDWGPFSEAVLANLIYGPSYISREYALALYGLIPERVPLITSVSLKPSKIFKTDVGNFDYKQQSQERYACGMTLVNIDHQRNYLVATPEKALVDTIFEKNISSTSELFEYLEQSLRIEKHSLKNLNTNNLQDLAKRFRRPIINALVVLNKDLKS